MGTQETKKQHWVPQTYLSKFGKKGNTKEIQIYAIDKELKKNCFLTNITNICAENNLYTLTGETVEQRQLIENFYGDNFDNKYNAFYALLTDPTVKSINSEQSKLIISIAITLLFRNPLFKGYLIQQKKNEFLQSATLAKIKKYDQFEFGGDIYKVAESDQGFLDYLNKKNEIMIISQVAQALRLISIRQFDQIHIIKIDDHEHSLLTCDHPIVLYNRNSKITSPFDINSEIKLPLDPSHNLYIYAHDETTKYNYITRYNHKGVLSKREMLTSNREQQKWARRFVLGHKYHIETFQRFMSNQDNLFSESENEELNKIDARFNSNYKNYFL